MSTFFELQFSNRYLTFISMVIGKRVEFILQTRNTFRNKTSRIQLKT